MVKNEKLLSLLVILEPVTSRSLFNSDYKNTNQNNEGVVTNSQRIKTMVILI